MFACFTLMLCCNVGVMCNKDYNVNCVTQAYFTNYELCMFHADINDMLMMMMIA